MQIHILYLIKIPGICMWFIAHYQWSPNMQIHLRELCLELIMQIHLCGLCLELIKCNWRTARLQPDLQWSRKATDMQLHSVESTIQMLLRSRVPGQLNHQKSCIGRSSELPTIVAWKHSPGSTASNLSSAPIDGQTFPDHHGATSGHSCPRALRQNLFSEKNLN